MKPHRPLLAALMLLAWLITSSHIVLEHGGDWWGCHAEAGLADGQHDEDSEVPDGSHHHHDLGVMLLGKALAVQKVIPAPLAWTPLADFIFGNCTSAPIIETTPSGRAAIDDSPPDARSSGWLLIAHTARPVRGPALAA